MKCRCGQCDTDTAKQCDYLINATTFIFLISLETNGKQCLLYNGPQLDTVLCNRWHVHMWKSYTSGFLKDRRKYQVALKYAW